MKDTWFARDRPVLDAVLELMEELTPGWPRARDISNRTGLGVPDVVKALKTLEGEYIELQPYLDGDGGATRILSVNAEARRAVGQWPTIKGLSERLVEALQDAAEQETDPVKKGRLRRAAEGLAGIGKDLLVEVTGAAIARGTFGG